MPVQRATWRLGFGSQIICERDAHSAYKLRMQAEHQATLRVCVASTNPVKIAAVQGAFTKSFPSNEIVVVGKGVSSGVADQPMTDIETRQAIVKLKS